MMGAAVRLAARHDLLRLTANGWARLSARADMGGAALWAARDFPVMRRRRQPGDRAALVAVAVAWPNPHRRSGLAFEVAPGDVARVERPPLLRDVRGGLPDLLGTRAQAVLAMAGEIGLEPRLFGSAMWQHVTGMPYVRDGSDLDLLWDVPDGRDAASFIGRLVSALRTLDAAPGPRLDGEIVLRGAAGVHWRELLPGAGDTLLVKTADDVALMSRAAFLQPGSAAC